MRATLLALLAFSSLAYGLPGVTVTTLTSSPNPSVPGQTISLTATVSPTPDWGTPTGIVIFAVNGVPSPFPVVLDEGGKATLTGVSPAPGVYTITASYNGDGTFGGSVGTVTHTVIAASTLLGMTSSPNPSVPGQAVTLVATATAVPPATGTPTGSVTFTYPNGSTVTAALDGSGQASITTSSIPVGLHGIAATYYGDSNFSSSGWKILQVVTQPATTTIVSASPNPSVSGQTVTFTATVAPVPPSSGTPTGTVTFAISGGPSLTGVVINGQASVTAVLTPGSHSVSATYNGDSHSNASSGSTTQIVTKSSSTTSVSASHSPSFFNEPVTFTASVAAVAPATGTPAGTVTFAIAGGPSLTGTLNGSGQASVTTSTLVPGSRTVTATYNGNSDFNGSSGTVNHTTNPGVATISANSSPNPSVVGQTVTLTAQVSPVAQALGARKEARRFASRGDSMKMGVSAIAPTGTVNFSVAGGPVLTGTLDASGHASVTTNALVVGSQTITATYTGDTNFAGTSPVTINHVVNQGSSNAVLSSSANPSVSGQPVTFTATISQGSSGLSVPTGSVTFFDGATSLGVVTLSAGHAVLVVPALPVGNHSISAVYSGDATFTGSTATALSQMVGSASTATAINASSNPSAYAQAVTFTAVVSIVAPGSVTTGSGQPSGIVTFKDGATVLGTGVVTDGRASLSTSSLTGGAHSIIATYGGDTSFAGSTSAGLAHSISKSATTTGLVLVSSGNISAGDDYTVRAAVSSSAGTPTGAVTFQDTSGVLDRIALVNGVATLTKTAPVKANYNITATYNGDSNFSESASARVSFSVSMVQTRVSTPALVSGAPMYGQALTLSVNVAPGIGNEPITFRDGGTVIGTANLDSSSNATITVSSLGIGTHSITASSEGNESHGAATSMPLAQVIQGIPTVTLEGAQAATGSAAIRFTATVKAPVTDAPMPGGTVTFSEGTTTLGTGTLNASGQATLTPSSALSAGAHNIVARYSGDPNYVAASSAPLGQEVSKAASATSLGMVVSNEGLSLTAAVTSSVTGTPGGAVQFLDTTAGTILGSGSLAKGTATLVIPAPLPVGHSVQASYSGDESYKGSESAPQILIVGANSFSNMISDMAPNQFVSLFGEGFSTETSAVAGETAAGTKVTFTDGSGKDYRALVIYASPSQVNFVVPSDIPMGPARITVATSSDTSFTLGVTIRPVNPGIASIDGKLAAAQFVVTHEDGKQQPPISTAVYDEASDSWKLAPPAWGATDQLHLILYATGLRNVSSQVTCSVGTQKLESLYAGPQPDFPGLDQINLRIPESLRSAGTIQVTCTVDGTVSNTTSVALP